MCITNNVYLIIIPHWIIDKQEFISLEYDKYKLANPDKIGIDTSVRDKEREISQETFRLAMIERNKIKKYPEDNHLPKFIYRVTFDNTITGYRVDFHPNIKSRRFANKHVSMAENLRNAMIHLNINLTMTSKEMDDIIEKCTNYAVILEPILPKYMYKVIEDKEHIGYRVRHHPDIPAKSFQDKHRSLKDSLKMAMDYYYAYLDALAALEKEV